MSFVIDASIAAAWYFPDEDSPLANQAAAQLAVDRAWVPDLFWFEVRNLLLMGERRLRVGPSDVARFLGHLDGLPITMDAKPSSDEVMALARGHGLTVYDAAYLELARRRSLPLATLDRRLAEAARAAGIGLVEAG